MKRIGKLSPLFGSDNLDVDSNKIGWQRSDAIFSATFSLLQAGLILGLLRVGMVKLDSPLLAILWGGGYLAMGLYVLTGTNYLFAMLFNRLGWGDDKRLIKWSFRILTFLSAMAVPYIVDGLTSEVIIEALK